MSPIDALAAIALLMDFLVGIGCGVLLITCTSSAREDKLYSLWGIPPGSAAAGARILLGVGFRRGWRRGSPRYGGRQYQHGRGRNR